MENIPCSMRMDGFNSLLTYLSLRFRDKKVHFVILLQKFQAKTCILLFKKIFRMRITVMHNFSMLLTQKCLSMGLIDKSYSEWLSYSIEKRATTLLTWFVLCLVGFFGFGWKLTLSFSIFFLLIRKYTNGYHAATYSHCLFLSILMEIRRFYMC